MDIKSNSQGYSLNGQDGAVPALVASAKETGSSVSKEFHNFLQDMEDMIKNTTSMTGEDLAIVRDKIGKRVSEARESIEDAGEEIAHRARKTAKMTDNYVHDEPWKAIGVSAGVGAGVGFLLGLLVSKRS